MFRDDRDDLKLEQVSIRLVSDTPLYSEKPVTTSRDAVELVGRMMSELDREMICIINLNGKGKPINMNVVSVGGLSSAYCEPANVFKSAILCNAAFIIVLHNHPSGDTTPSREDIALTNRLIKAGNLMGIPVLDHIVIGYSEDTYYSMQEHRVCDFALKEQQQVAGEQQIRRKPPAR